MNMFLLFLILISSYNSAKITEIDQGFDRVAVPTDCLFLCTTAGA